MQPPMMSSSRWGVRTKRIVAIGVMIVSSFLLWHVRSIFPLIIVSILFAYLLWPLVNLIEKRILFFMPFPTRSLAVVLTLIFVFSQLIFVLILVVPVLVRQIADVGQDLPDFLATVEVELENILSHPISINGVPITINGQPIVLKERLEAITGERELGNIVQFDQFDMMTTLRQQIGGLTGQAFNVLGEALDFVINFAFLIVIVFYLLRDGEQFVGHIVNAAPKSYQGDVRRLLYELGNVWNAYLRGQLILCVSVGSVVYIAALILGLPNAPILGLISGILEIIPNFGAAMALIPAVFTALVSDSSTIPFLSGPLLALVVIIIWTGIQNLEAIFLVPRVMGGRLNLHPMVVILAVIAGATVAGALGVVLAALFTATIRLMGLYIYGKLFDMNPFPSESVSEADSTSWVLVRFVQAVIPQRFYSSNSKKEEVLS